MKTKTIQQNRVATLGTDRVAPAVLAILLGVFFVFGAGFAHSQALHDTAHDTRHAFSFPCH